MPDAEQPTTLHQAIMEFQKDPPRIVKNAEANTGKYGYEYVTLAKLHAEVLPRLNELGLVWMTMPSNLITEGSIVPALEYELAFEGRTREVIRGSVPLMVGRGGPQDLGGAITYLRRYCLCAVLGLVPDKDDDAERAQEAATRKPPEPVKKHQAEEIAARAHAAGVLDRLQLAASHVLGDDVGDCNTVNEATEALMKLTVPQAGKLAEWVEKKEQADA